MVAKASTRMPRAPTRISRAERRRARQLRTAERRAMDARRETSPRRKQAFATVSPDARTHAAGLARPRRRGNRATRRTTAHAPFASSIRSRCRRSRIRRRTTGGYAAEAPFSPATRSKARAPSSSASATSPIRRRCARAAQNSTTWIRSAAEHGNSLKVPPKTDPIVAGWLELGPVAVELARNPMRAAAALAQLEALYPAHPANDSVLRRRRSRDCRRHRISRIRSRCCCRCRAAPRRSASPCATAFSPRISSRMPRRGRTCASTTSPPQPVAGAYSQAIDEGAGFVVGPLTKEDVAAVAPLSSGPHAGARA